MTFTLVPRHAGIKGNERVDCLTNRTTVVDNRVMDRGDILPDVEEAGQNEISDTELDPTSSTRLLKLGVTRHVSRAGFYIFSPFQMLSTINH